MSKYYKLQAELLSLPLTPRAAILYAVLADRQELSKKNELFRDSHGCYIIYRIEDICTVLGVGERTAKYLLAELEDSGLIERKKQGKNHPQKIYVHEVQDFAPHNQNKVQKTAPYTADKVQDFAPPEVQDFAPPNSIYTDGSNTDTSSSTPAAPKPEPKPEPKQEPKQQPEQKTNTHLPELIRTIDEIAAQLHLTLTDKDRLKILRKIQKHGKGIHALKPWLRAVMASGSWTNGIADDDDSGKGYQPSYDIEEYESTSVLDEDWDD